MKRTIKILTALLLIAIFAIPETEAQTRASIKSGSAKKREEANSSLSVRAQNLYEKEEMSAADIPWNRIIYRSLDLKKEKNLPLYYPEESTEEQDNLFRLIMKLLAVTPSASVIVNDPSVLIYIRPARRTVCEPDPDWYATTGTFILFAGLPSIGTICPVNDLVIESVVRIPDKNTTFPILIKYLLPEIVVPPVPTIASDDT